MANKSKKSAFPVPLGYAEMGISRRDYFAAAALQGIMADPTSQSHFSDKAKRAVIAADYLIEHLDKEE